MKYVLASIILIVLFFVPGMAKQEDIQVGNHTVSMYIPDYPQYYISSTVLGNQESIEIVFNQSLLKTILIGPQSISISIYSYPNGRNETFEDMISRLDAWANQNYPGNYTLYKKNMLETTGIVVVHHMSDFYHNLEVLDANAYLDRDYSGRAFVLVNVISDYDMTVTGAIIDSMKINTNT